MTSDDLVAQYHNDHLRTLGICWVIYGIIRLVAAIWLVSFTNTATVMFGALLSRVADPFAMMNFFHLIYTLLVILSVVCGVLGIVAGCALLAMQKSGRLITLVAALLSLSDIPLGITIGIFSLVILLPMTATQASTQAIGSKAFAMRGQPTIR